VVRLLIIALAHFVCQECLQQGNNQVELGSLMKRLQRSLVHASLLLTTQFII
jgi:hypothetical protein